MVATAKDLRFKISLFFDILSKGEEIIITYRGKPKAKLIPYEDAKESKQSEDQLFGIWKDREDDVEVSIREMRKGRDFAL